LESKASVSKIASSGNDLPGASESKLRGAYFTPSNIANFLSEWAIRAASSKVLEPSCGDGAILVAAVKKLRALDSSTSSRPTVDGVEIHPESALMARERVTEAGGIPRVQIGDFFTMKPKREFSAVVGNPPFIRFHDFTGAARQDSIAAARAAGVEISGLASSWAAFVVHSTQFLTPGGRLAMVLPSELLTVDYASAVRKYLLEHFTVVSIVTFSEPVFPRIQTDAILLLADGYGGSTDRVDVRSPVSSAKVFSSRSGRELVVADAGDKWSAGRVSAAFISDYGTAAALNGVGQLRDWGSVSLGVVTGNNAFFTMSSAEIGRHGIAAEDLRSIAPPMKPAKRGLGFTDADWNRLLASGSKAYLFYPRNGGLDINAAKYVEYGESIGANEGFKCRTRTPWWRVPIGDSGDLIVTYMSSEVPRIVNNARSYLHLNSLHRFRLHPASKRIGKTYLSIAGLSSLTLVGAELSGRAYGGGVLKLELGEVAGLPVPSPETIQQAAAKLKSIAPELDRLLRAGRALEASGAVDNIILRGELGLSKSVVATLRATHTELRENRRARSSDNSGELRRDN
jgi:tRNA1(Val) A37 N6-methylase TrmN6